MKEQIFRRTRAPEFLKFLEGLILELCRVDTTPKPDPGQMAQAEDACFRILERELRGLSFPGARIERRPVDCRIASHPSYAPPRELAKLPPERAYGARGNLLFQLAGRNQASTGTAVALNAHVDVVPPYFPPRARGGVIHGRGACDDKGPVASVVGALKVLSEVMAETGWGMNRNVLGMFVIEEETGGNGSLSLALDAELLGDYGAILVCECTGLKIHPANRGAVWYRAEISPPPGVSALELFAFVIEELEKEGAALRAESLHPLFPQRPVQTSHGVLGPFGQHPSRICGEAAFEIRFERPPLPGVEKLARDCLESGLAGYVGLYGDKTKVRDGQNGQPLVRRHYEMTKLPRGRQGFRVRVFGATGHMGAIRERDGALTKMAHLVRSLVYSKARLELLAGCPVQFEMAREAKSSPLVASPPRSLNQESTAPSVLVLEGGQGFLPTHSMEEIMRRLRRAAELGAENCLRRLGRAEKGGDVIVVSYEKLRNAAFDGDPRSPAVQHAIAAAKACGLWTEEPIVGWTVSCDARLFATQYPQSQVLTFGPGQLAYAHSDQEQIAVEEARAAAEFLALFLLRATGTASA